MINHWLHETKWSQWIQHEDQTSFPLCRTTPPRTSLFLCVFASTAEVTLWVVPPQVWGWLSGAVCRPGWAQLQSPGSAAALQTLFKRKKESKHGRIKKRITQIIYHWLARKRWQKVISRGREVKKYLASIEQFLNEPIGIKTSKTHSRQNTVVSIRRIKFLNLTDPSKLGIIWPYFGIQNC